MRRGLAQHHFRSGSMSRVASHLGFRRCGSSQHHFRRRDITRNGVSQSRFRRCGSKKKVPGEVPFGHLTEAVLVFQSKLAAGKFFLCFEPTCPVAIGVFVWLAMSLGDGAERGVLGDRLSTL